jgi:hypothetical protein
MAISVSLFSISPIRVAAVSRGSITLSASPAKRKRCRHPGNNSYRKDARGGELKCNAAKVLEKGVIWGHAEYLSAHTRDTAPSSC